MAETWGRVLRCPIAKSTVNTTHFIIWLNWMLAKCPSARLACRLFFYDQSIIDALASLLSIMKSKEIIDRLLFFFSLAL